MGPFVGVPTIKVVALRVWMFRFEALLCVLGFSVSVVWG